MAVSLSNFGKLNPEIQLAQAISEYEAALVNDDEKASLRHLKATSRPPDAIDVIRLTAEIDRTSQTGRRCVGTRFSNVLRAIQAFAAIGDVVVGGSQNMMASGLWALVRFTLQVATNYASFLEKFSELFMNIGRSAPRYQNLGLLYPRSSSLQRSICEYFIIIVKICTKAVQFTRRNGLNRLLVTTLRSFDSEFGESLSKLEVLGNAIKEDVMVLSAKTQQDEVRENSLFRSLLLHKLDKSDESRRKLAVKLSLLDRCSVYDYGSTWRQIRKKGNSSWICKASEYINWKNEPKGNIALVCFGKLGSGKSVLASNITEDLIVHAPKGTVAYFFCRYDVTESLNARTILGSLIRQLVESLDVTDSLDSMTYWTKSQTHSFAIDELVALFREFILEKLEKKHVFFVIDGLDDCEETEKQLTIQYLRLLTESNSVQLFLTTRSELEPVAVLIKDSFPEHSKLYISRQTDVINDYISDKLDQRLESGALCLSNPEIIVEIQNTLKANAQGMFLWVVLQIDSICDEETDDAILTALRDLPPDLPAVYDRILQKNSRSKYRKKIFQLVSSAYRPLTLCELREALSVTPGENTMDPTKFINDIQRTISCCGGLIELDEEALTVHFVHPSAKQHLLCPDTESSTSDGMSSRFSSTDADLLMGSICVTYLSWNVFETRLTSHHTPWQINGSDTVSAVVGSPFQSTSVAKKIAQMYLKKTRRSSSVSSGSSSFDFKRALMETCSGTSDKQPPAEFFFLPYAKEYWLGHTKRFTESMGNIWISWCKLVDNPPAIIDRLPWNEPFHSSTVDLVLRKEEWAVKEGHLALQFALFINHRPELLHIIDSKEEIALKHQLKGDWPEAAKIRLDIVNRLKPIYDLSPLDVLRAIWNLALSYRAFEYDLAQSISEELLTEFVLKLKAQNRPLVDNILDSSLAFQRARNNIWHQEIAEQVLHKTFALSRTLLGESDFNTIRLLHDIEHFEERHTKSLAL